ncbi:T9SS type A sorting domain-containing protein [Flavobacterium difficile]|uniref:T9SS type A sorting domain-containing protein n=1 Tax=Flavobacterium difficile TaxID=2709659 RepID=A0ABX0I5T1_9FLAO|nr:T9SS type A sorting domain-containing protein [Flavobacterium difficile]NHM00826.1 T9SS type A sorting domain-containing protein [Flavobacterium difficile]
MKAFFYFLCLMIFATSNAQEYQYHSAQLYESTNGNITMKKVVKDDNGNYYICGVFIGTVDFDPSTAVFTATSTNKLVAFVQKLDANRNFISVKTLVGIGSNDLVDIKDMVIKNNELLLAGAFTGSVDFDPSVATNIQTVTTGSLISNGDFFVAKYNLNIDLLWVKKTGSTSSDVINSIYVEENGKINAVGQFTGSTDFDTGSTNLIISTNGQGDAFYWQLDTNGAFLKAFKLGGSFNDEAFKVKVYNNQLFISGAFSATVDFNPSTTVTNNLVSSSGFNGFVAKYALNDHSYLQAVRITPQILDMDIDGSGNVFTTGLFNAATDDFDPSPTATFNLSSSTFAKNYIVKLDSNLNFIWVKDFAKNDYGNNEFVDFDIDQNGNLYSVSRFKGVVDMDPSTAVFNLTPLAVNLYTKYHIFLQKLTNEGVLTYAGFVGNTSSDYNFLNDILVSNGEIIGVGDFDNTIDLDPNNTNQYKTNPNGQKDAYILRLTENTLSLSDFSNVRFDVFPNPTSNIVFITANDAINEIALFSLDGKQISKQKCNAFQYEMDLSAVQSGVYLIHIQTENLQSKTLKIIKN